MDLVWYNNDKKIVKNGEIHMNEKKDKAMKLLFTKAGWEKVEKHLAQLEKNKKVSSKFISFIEALSLIKDIADEDDKIEIEYNYTNGTIYWRSYYISVYDIEKLRKLISLTDIFGAVVMDDDRVQIDFTYKDIFEIDKPKF